MWQTLRNLFGIHIPTLPIYLTNSMASEQYEYSLNGHLVEQALVQDIKNLRSNILTLSTKIDILEKDLFFHELILLKMLQAHPEIITNILTELRKDMPNLQVIDLINKIKEMPITF